ncbi:sugar ABC transporter permease [Clostridia bacterium]|nr:sugar ABC transporter permease [Clostridia bacterium]
MNSQASIMNRNSTPQRFLSRGARVRFGVLSLLVNLLLYVFAVSYVFPFLFMLFNSLKDKKLYQASMYSFPTKPLIDNYASILGSDEFYLALRNTLVNTAVTIFFVVIFAFMIAYFTSRYNFRGRKFCYYFFLVGMLIPVHALLIPTYILYRSVGIINKWYTLWIPYVTFGIPQALFLFDSYIASIPKSLEEAAVIDGATIPYTMRTIIFPLSLPMVFTVGLLNFMGAWNEFSFALILSNSKNLKTIPLWLQNFQGQYTSNTPMRLTAMFISCVPILLMFIFFREKMMSGIAAGAVKG